MFFNYPNYYLFPVKEMNCYRTNNNQNNFILEGNNKDNIWTDIDGEYISKFLQRNN